MLSKPMLSYNFPLNNIKGDSVPYYMFLLWEETGELEKTRTFG
jgi:hypothetical protein